MIQKDNDGFENVFPKKKINVAHSHCVSSPRQSILKLLFAAFTFGSPPPLHLETDFILCFAIYLCKTGQA